MAKHDENKCLRSVGRIGKVSPGDRTLRIAKTATVGIHMWGKIDYLTHYCGWRLIYDNNIVISNEDNTSEKDKKKELKKAKKEHKLQNKNSKKSLKKK